MKFILFITFFLTLFISQAQEIVESENIGDCFGAVNLEEESSLESSFTGKAGFNNDVQQYSKELQKKAFNTLWLKIKQELSGIFKVNLSDLPKQTEITIFEVDKSEKCKSIHAGNAKIIFHSLVDDSEAVISTDLQIFNDRSYYFYLNTSTEGSPSFNITSSFEIRKSKEQIESLRNTKDLREDIMQDKFTVAIIDEETELPVDGSIIVKNTKSYNALYDANVLLFPDNEYLAFNLEINAMGYFFMDVSFARRNTNSDTLLIRLKPVKTNDQIELEGLQFESQSDVLLESAKSKIRRLRDFMALNKSINIQVVGHVFKEGKNSWKAKRLSKQRAKRVKEYLESSGIDADRISIKGMGNSQMIYPEPENDLQIQANRRVEIKIK
jgi:outer membrane protein OmpA-like peptidoglycan-associated protein